MPKTYPCYCKSYKCNSKHTLTLQTIHHSYVIPHIPSKPPPLIPPYSTKGPLLQPIVNFPDPLANSPSAVEQQMLDHGMLTQEAIDLQVYDSELPNLGLNSHSLDAPLDAFEYYSTYDEGHAFQHAMDKALENIQQEQEIVEDEPMYFADVDDEIMDVDCEIKENTDLPLDTINTQE
ncbi:hypothetical protein V8B97DRAFT_2011546 [Scleroderma yunnanense]